jgi:predicted transcriptional regulator of viral defense system
MSMSKRSPSTERYGGLGVALLWELAEQGRSTFTVSGIRKTARRVGVAESYLAVLLHRLHAAGMVRRLQRGTYALASGLPGVPEAHPFAIGMALVRGAAVSGWSALHHHGLTEQIPRVVTLTTTRRVATPSMRGASKAAPSTWRVAGQTFEIVTVVPHHFFGDEDVWVGEAKVRIFDRERALLDCFALPRRFGGIAEGLGIVEEHLSGIDVKRLVAHALRYGTDAVARRVGFALEECGVSPGVVKPLRTRPMTGFRALDPTRTPRGPRSPRWNLIENMAAPRVVG